MPRSARSTVVHLSNVKGRGRARKDDLIESVRQAIDEYDTVHVFSVDDCRDADMRRIRVHFRSSGRLFFGKNKVVGVALGKNKNDSYKKGTFEISKLLRGKTALLCTNSDQVDAEAFLRGVEFACVPKAGEVSESTEYLTHAQVSEAHAALQERLVDLKVPVDLSNGSLTLSDELLPKGFEICIKGDVLTKTQCSLLKLFDRNISTFSVALLGRWSKKSGKCVAF